ncbi:MAG TPA: ribonuclease III [Armatimonadota bacterium]|nr:ribonuclease III [Armatimonadota bacterium]
MNSTSEPGLEKIARKLKMKKENLELLRQALTHKSYLGEVSHLVSNERLEFLGDAVLGMVVSEHLYARFGEKQEGELAKAKAVAVSEPILAEAAKKFGLPPALFLSTGEETSGGRSRSSTLADAFEAVVAAVYLSQGLEAARQLLLKALRPILEDIEREEHHRNYKSILQELTQGLYKKAPNYVVVSESGADHDKTFVVEAQLDGRMLGSGSGKSKKLAEQAAALDALEHPDFESKRGR